MKKELARLRFITMALLAASAVVAAIVLMLPPRVHGFSYARSQGWDAQPVRVVRLEPPWIRVFEPIPKPLTPRDYAPIRACWVSPTTPAWEIYYGKNGSTVALRQLYQRAVAQFPGSFYPEQCLAEWYAEHQNMPQYNYWQQRALRDAPAIIAGKVFFDDGRPTTHARFQVFLQTYDSAHTMMGHAISFSQEATTDGEGCYYLPSYRGIYARESPGVYVDSLFDSRSDNFNLYVPGPTLANFDRSSPNRMIMGMVTTSRVGVLPPIFARQKVQFVIPFQPASDDEKHPVALSGDALNFAWRQVPGAVRYTVQVDVRSVGPYQGVVVMPQGGPSSGSTARPEWRIPVINEALYGNQSSNAGYGAVYALTVYAHSSPDPQSLDDTIDCSDEYLFTLKHT